MLIVVMFVKIPRILFKVLNYELLFLVGIGIHLFFLSTLKIK
jgi:hypothetical protein